MQHQKSIWLVTRSHTRQALHIGLIIISLQSLSTVEAFVHPGGQNSRAELDFVKSKVKAGAQPWKSGYDQVKRENSYLSASSRAMSVVKVVAYPSGPDPRWDLTGDAEIVYGCALLWYIDGNESYAKKGIQILMSWVNTFQKFDGPDANLAAGYCWPPFLWGAEILRFYSGWSAADQTKAKTFFRNKVLPYVNTSGTGNNWASWRLSCELAIGVFLDDQEIFNKGINGMKAQITSYISASGHSDEICRDLHHAQMGIGPLVNGAEIAWQQGIDLYGVGGNLILKAEEYLVPLILNTSISKPPSGSCTISDYKRTTIHNYHWTVFHHYAHRLGLSAPQTERMVNKTNPEPFHRYGWGTLTHWKLPTTGKPTLVVKNSEPIQLNAASTLLTAGKHPVISLTGRAIRNTLLNYHGEASAGLKIFRIENAKGQSVLLLKTPLFSELSRAR